MLERKINENNEEREGLEKQVTIKCKEGGGALTRACTCGQQSRRRTRASARRTANQ